MAHVSTNNFEKPPLQGFPVALDCAASASPLPYQAWHDYGVTCTYNGEVEVCANGHANAPHSGATAASPPAGALQIIFVHYQRQDFTLGSPYTTFQGHMCLKIMSLVGARDQIPICA
jgi:hypothetical protein